MSALTDALDELGVPYKLNGFYTSKPGDDRLYAAVFEDVRYDGADDSVGVEFHEATVELYDNGGKAAETFRRALSNELARRNVKHTRSASEYIQSEKKYVTVYETATWTEKWRP